MADVVGEKLVLRVEGLPTEQDVETSRAHLLAGDRSLAEISEQFRVF